MRPVHRMDILVILRGATFSLMLKIYLRGEVEICYHQVLYNNQDTTNAPIGQKPIVDCTGKPMENWS